MAETEDERMAREISQEQGRTTVREEQHGPVYRGYRRRESMQEKDVQELAERSARPQKEIHLKRSYVNEAKQAAEKGLNIVGHYAGATAGAVAGAYNKYESWQEKGRQKAIEREPYEQYKTRREEARIALETKREQLRQIQEKSGGGIRGMARDVLGGRAGGGYRQPYPRYQPQQQQNYGLLGGGQPTNALDLGANMPTWFQQATGRPQQQQRPAYGQKSYEYPTGGQGRPTRRYYRDEESRELAERNRELKSKQKQLRRIARRERALANREASLSQYRERQAPPPQQGQGGGVNPGSISGMLGL